MSLDVPEWVIQDLRRYLEVEIETLSDHVLTQADLYRAEKQRMTLALVVGQIDTHLEDLEHRFNESLLESRRRAVEDAENCRHCGAAAVVPGLCELHGGG